MTTTTEARIPQRRLTTLLALIAPSLITLGSIGLAWSWRNDLPDPVAVHWGTNGPDGFGSMWPHTLVPLGVALLMAAGLWALAFFGGRDAITRRGAAGTAVFFAAMMSSVSIGGLYLQLGLDDAKDARDIGWVIAIGFAVSTVLAVLTALADPGDPPAPAIAPLPQGAKTLALKEAQKVTWIRETGDTQRRRAARCGCRRPP